MIVGNTVVHIHLCTITTMFHLMQFIEKPMKRPWRERCVMKCFEAEIHDPGMWHVPLLSSTSFPLTCAETLTSFCEEQNSFNKTRGWLVGKCFHSWLEWLCCNFPTRINDLFSCIALPSPLHDLLEALHRSDTDTSAQQLRWTQIS